MAGLYNNWQDYTKTTLVIFTISVERFGGGELREQPANPGSPGKMAVKTECVCVVERLYTGNGW